MAPRRQCRKRIKKHPLTERSEFRTILDFSPGGVCSPCEARTAIIGVAFSCLPLLAKAMAAKPTQCLPDRIKQKAQSEDWANCLNFLGVADGTRTHETGITILNATKNLALFNLAIDSRQRGCDLVSLRACDMTQGTGISARSASHFAEHERGQEASYRDQASESCPTRRTRSRCRGAARSWRKVRMPRCRRTRR